MVPDESVSATPARSHQVNSYHHTQAKALRSCQIKVFTNKHPRPLVGPVVRKAGPQHCVRGHRLSVSWEAALETLQLLTRRGCGTQNREILLQFSVYVDLSSQQINSLETGYKQFNTGPGDQVHHHQSLFEI